MTSFSSHIHSFHTSVFCLRLVSVIWEGALLCNANHPHCLFSLSQSFAVAQEDDSVSDPVTSWASIELLSITIKLQTVNARATTIKRWLTPVFSICRSSLYVVLFSSLIIISHFCDPSAFQYVSYQNDFFEFLLISCVLNVCYSQYYQGLLVAKPSFSRLSPKLYYGNPSYWVRC